MDGWAYQTGCGSERLTPVALLCFFFTTLRFTGNGHKRMKHPASRRSECLVDVRGQESDWVETVESLANQGLRNAVPECTTPPYAMSLHMEESARCT